MLTLIVDSKAYLKTAPGSSSNSSLQAFLQLPTDNFVDQVVTAFMPVDIPLSKLRNPHIRELSESIVNPLPSKSFCRRRVGHLASQKAGRVTQLLTAEFLCHK